jgi:hypothetical protein
VKKVKIQDSMDKTNFFLSTLRLNMVACRSSSKDTTKMNLIPVLNKTSPWAHMELELGVLGVHGKLVKYVVQKKKLKKNYFSSHKLAKQQLTSFWSQGILGINTPYVP